MRRPAGKALPLPASERTAKTEQGRSEEGGSSITGEALPSGLLGKMQGASRELETSSHPIAPISALAPVIFQAQFKGLVLTYGALNSLEAKDFGGPL